MNGSRPPRCRSTPLLRFECLGVLALLLTSAAADAKTLAPSLDPASEAALFKALGDAGLAERPRYSVKNALVGVLGFEPATRRYVYRQPERHLPDVDARASKGQDGCVRVALQARPKDEPRRSISIRGTYCLAVRARGIWSARTLAVR